MSRLATFKMVSVAIGLAAIFLTIVSSAFAGQSFAGGFLLGALTLVLLEEVGL